MNAIMNQPLPQSETTLPQHFIPSNNHVIIGRGKKTYNHPGNTIFRSAIQSRLSEYSQAKTKNAKSLILIDIVQSVHATGGFVKKDAATGQWMTAGTCLAREKVSQTIRDILSDDYKSSKASKKKRRQEQLVSATTSDDYMTQQHGKRRRQNNEHDFQPIPYNSTATINFSDSDFLSRLYDAISPSLAELDDMSSLEPTPLLEDENYDIDNIFESSVVSDDEDEKNDMGMFFESTLEFDQLEKELSCKKFFEMADFFLKESDMQKSKNFRVSKNHSVDFPEFQPLRNVASARTA